MNPRTKQLITVKEKNKKIRHNQVPLFQILNGHAASGDNAVTYNYTVEAYNRQASPPVGLRALSRPGPA